MKITSIRGDAFRGELAERPASARGSKLRLGSPVAFTTAHIHSLPNATLKIGKRHAKEAAPRQCPGKGDIAILAYDRRDREAEKLRDRLTKRKRRPRLQIMKEPTAEPGTLRGASFLKPNIGGIAHARVAFWSDRSCPVCAALFIITHTAG